MPYMHVYFQQQNFVAENPFTFLSELKNIFNKIKNKKRNHAHYYWESKRERKWN